MVLVKENNVYRLKTQIDHFFNPIQAKYLGNILDLEESSLSILNEIQKKYSNKDNLCFLHTTKTLKFYCLHFHIIKKEYYKRNYPKKETGSFMIQDIFIDEAINNLEHKHT